LHYHPSIYLATACSSLPLPSHFPSHPHLTLQRAPARPLALYQKEEGETLVFVMQGRGGPRRRSGPSLPPLPA
jgi:hypothetical protein